MKRVNDFSTCGSPFLDNGDLRKGGERDGVVWIVGGFGALDVVKDNWGE
jgi:hypothetical protein